MMDLKAPLKSLQWVPINKLKPNNYNPNVVTKENLELLTQSILTNGWTLPIVVKPDYTIIDGFHRWTVAQREPLKNKLSGWSLWLSLTIKVTVRIFTVRSHIIVREEPM